MEFCSGKQTGRSGEEGSFWANVDGVVGGKEKERGLGKRVIGRRGGKMRSGVSLDGVRGRYIRAEVCGSETVGGTSLVVENFVLAGIGTLEVASRERSSLQFPSGSRTVHVVKWAKSKEDGHVHGGAGPQRFGGLVCDGVGCVVVLVRQVTDSLFLVVVRYLGGGESRKGIPRESAVDALGQSIIWGCARQKYGR